MLLAMAGATRNGTGLSFARNSTTTGVKTKHTISWFRKAESAAVATMSVSRKPAGLPRRRAMAPAIKSKKPDSRSCTTRTKKPNSNRIVGQLMKLMKSVVGKPEKTATAMAPRIGDARAVQLEAGHAADRDPEIGEREDRQHRLVHPFLLPPSPRDGLAWVGTRRPYKQGEGLRTLDAYILSTHGGGSNEKRRFPMTGATDAGAGRTTIG